MKVMMIILSSLLLNGCFLFMYECDSLTGWCTNSGSSPSLYEYDFWRTKKEIKSLSNSFAITLNNKEKSEEDQKNRYIIKL